MVRKSISLFFLFFIPYLFISSAQATTISAYVDRQDIGVNESFNMVFEADGSVDDDPDFSPLSVYFDILSQNQSSNMTIINGNFSRKRVWTLTLLAKQAGTYALPAIEFGKDKSRPITISINKASSKTATADKSLFLETEVDSKTAYVQSQIIYTVRLFRSVDISNASLSEPELSAADAIVEKLGEDNRYQTNRNGVRYLVVERKYAIFPQQSGQLTISPLEFKGQIVSQRRSFFDITPFNNTTRRIVSDAINISVKPVPAVFANKHWLPAADVKLVDKWQDNAEFKVGEPVTRTLSLQASGLTAAQLPEIGQKQIDNIKQYPDRPALNNQQDNNGIVGIREEKIAYIPTQVGTYTLPEINIPWWNTKKGRLEFARVAAKKIIVKPGVSQPATATPLQQLPVQPDVSSAVQPEADSTSSGWIYTTVIFALLWLLTLAYLFARRKPASVTKPETTKPTSAAPLKNINKKFAGACHQKNMALCKTLLIEWAKQQWPDANIHTLGEITRHLADDPLTRQINILNQSLYASKPENWDADELLTAFNNYKGKPVVNFSGSQTTLKPITKLQ